MICCQPFKIDTFTPIDVNLSLVPKSDWSSNFGGGEAFSKLEHLGDGVWNLSL